MDCAGMMWMRLPGQGWLGAAASFLGMWTPMMALMMLPVLMPMLWRYRRASPETGARLNRLTALVAAGYLCVWTVFGLLLFPLGAALMEGTMLWPALARIMPLAAGLVVLLGGAMQFSAWKARRLTCCRELPGCMPVNARAAWRHGLLSGWRCLLCCAEPTAVLLALGVMDLGVMAVVTAAISAERLAPHGIRIARGLGAVALAAGAVLAVRAA
jgi:predicted metal-binding membrane protein